MRCKPVLFAVVCPAVLCIDSPASAQLWSGIIAPSGPRGTTGWRNRRHSSRYHNMRHAQSRASIAQINNALAACFGGCCSECRHLQPARHDRHAKQRDLARARHLDDPRLLDQKGSSFCWMGADVAVAFQGTGWSGSGDSAAPGAGGVPASTIRDWTGTNGQSGVYTQGATVLNLSSAPTGLTVAARSRCGDPTRPTVRCRTTATS